MFFQVFAIATLVSLVGTIPPATINISVMQLSITGKKKMAVGLSWGAAIIDLIYTYLSLQIHHYLNTHSEFTNYFQLVSASILFFLGLASLYQTRKSAQVELRRFRIQSGFLRGVLLGLFNPLVMPFWLVTTTYLTSQGWIDLAGINEWSFLAGVFLGEILLLLVIVRVGSKFTKVADNVWMVYIVPGLAFMVLGMYSLYEWASYYLN